MIIGVVCAFAKAMCFTTVITNVILIKIYTLTTHPTTTIITMVIIVYIHTHPNYCAANVTDVIPYPIHAYA